MYVTHLFRSEEIYEIIHILSTKISMKYTLHGIILVFLHMFGTYPNVCIRLGINIAKDTMCSVYCVSICVVDVHAARRLVAQRSDVDAYIVDVSSEKAGNKQYYGIRNT